MYYIGYTLGLTYTVPKNYIPRLTLCATYCPSRVDIYNYTQACPLMAQHVLSRCHATLLSYWPWLSHCLTAPLSHYNTVLAIYTQLCPTVPLSHCPTVLLSCCTTVPLPYCLTFPLSYCPTVILSYCTTVPLSVSLSYCLTVPLSYCLTVLLSHCLTVLLSYCTAVPLSYCPTVSHCYYRSCIIGTVMMS